MPLYILHIMSKFILKNQKNFNRCQFAGGGYTGRHTFSGNTDDDKPCFDQNLKQLYREYVSALCTFNNCKLTENHDHLIVKKKLYKKSELIKKRL